jgi:hypothetical protein
LGQNSLFLPFISGVERQFAFTLGRERTPLPNSGLEGKLGRKFHHKLKLFPIYKLETKTILLWCHFLAVLYGSSL